MHFLYAVASCCELWGSLTSFFVTSCFLITSAFGSESWFQAFWGSAVLTSKHLCVECSPMTRNELSSINNMLFPQTDHFVLL
jgi:hypothetical protein